MENELSGSFRDRKSESRPDFEEKPMKYEKPSIENMRSPNNTDHDSVALDYLELNFNKVFIIQGGKVGRLVGVTISKVKEGQPSYIFKLPVPVRNEGLKYELFPYDVQMIPISGLPLEDKQSIALILDSYDAKREPTMIFDYKEVIDIGGLRSSELREVRRLLDRAEKLVDVVEEINNIGWKEAQIKSSYIVTIAVAVMLLVAIVSSMFVFTSDDALFSTSLKIGWGILFSSSIAALVMLMKISTITSFISNKFFKRDFSKTVTFDLEMQKKLDNISKYKVEWGEERTPDQVRKIIKKLSSMFK